MPFRPKLFKRISLKLYLKSCGTIGNVPKIFLDGIPKTFVPQVTNINILTIPPNLPNRSGVVNSLIAKCNIAVKLKLATR